MKVRLDGRVALVTGAGRGLGRAHALVLAARGASVIVNDIGGAPDGSGADAGPAHDVVTEIKHAGGTGAVDTTDVSDMDGCEALVAQVLDRFGRLDILVNNAGILRPKAIVTMSEDDWTNVMRVHLDATFALTHHAAVHWREAAKRGGPPSGRLINTTSGSGLFANGQANYASAKAAIAAFTVVAAAELGRYGVTANAIAPVAATRLGAGVVPGTHTPDHAAHLVAWLASDDARHVTGRVFNIGGGHISVAEGWHTGPSADRDELWTVEEIGPVVSELVAKAAPPTDLLGFYPDDPRPRLDLRYARAAAGVGATNGAADGGRPS